jgi:hypothetical protein
MITLPEEPTVSKPFHVIFIYSQPLTIKALIQAAPPVSNFQCDILRKEHALDHEFSNVGFLQDAAMGRAFPGSAQVKIFLLA